MSINHNDVAYQTLAGLAGLRIIDFGQYLAGPMAAMLLADCGADVIRVDPPGGPRWDHPANATLQRNKRSIILDLKRIEDLTVARELIASADVVIEGFRPGVMSRLGLDVEEIRRLHPRLIWCSLPGFGHDDPRAGLAGWEGIVCSAASLYPPTQLATRGGPVFSAVPYASNMAAFMAAHSIVAALIARERYGHGDHIELALFDAACEAVALGLEDPPTISSERLYEMRDGSGISNAAENRLYKCKDGRLVYRDSPVRGKHNFWDRFMPASLKDDRSPEGAERAAQLLEELYSTKTACEWEKLGQEELRMACAVQQTSCEWLRDDHALASQTVVRVDDPVLGTATVAGLAVRVSNAPDIAPTPRSRLDADRLAILEETIRLGHTNRGQEHDVKATPVEGPTLPLSGLRALDYSCLLAAPGAGRILAEYGAEVIKINKAGVGLGKVDPTTDEPAALVAHKITAAGKKTMFLDLKSERGREVGKKLTDSTDIIIHNFPKGISEKLGLDEGELRQSHPDLIYSAITVHGSNGTKEGYRGHDHCAQAATGMMLRFGSDGSPQEQGILMNDFGTSHLAAFGILVGVFQRLRTGMGSRVEAALSRTATYCQLPYMLDFDGMRWDEPHGQDARGWGPLDRIYDCADGALYLAAITPDDISRLYSLESLVDIAGLTGKALEDSLEQRFGSEPRAVWLERLDKAGVPAHPYMDLESLLAEPLLASRGMVVTRHHPGMGEGQSMGIAARFASLPNRSVAPAARPGWHTFEILDELGYGHNEITDLIESEIIVGQMPENSIVDH